MTEKKAKTRLIGEYKYAVDPKRRLFIPVDFRVGRNWVATVGLDGCLFLFPEKEWDSITERIKTLPLTKQDARSFLRVLLSRAKVLSTDKQGRVLLPENLCVLAKLKANCIIIGMINRIELWSPEIWDNFFTKAQKDYTAIAENIAELDL